MGSDIEQDIKLMELAEVRVVKAVDRRINAIKAKLARNDYTSPENYRGIIEWRAGKRTLTIDFQKRRITSANPPSASIRSGDENPLAAAERAIVTRLQEMLFYKPLLDDLERFVDALPNFFDLPQNEIMALKKPRAIRASTIKDRIAVDLDSSSVRDVIAFLDEDFPGIFNDFAGDVLKEAISPTL